MNAIELLKADHKAVSKLFEQFKKDEDGDHTELFQKIKGELEAHTHIEETIFYPKLREEGDDELRKIVLEGIEEHRQVKMFLKEIDNLAGPSDGFNAKLKVVIEDVEHHVEEEEDEMFPMVEDQFDVDTLDELGAAMEAEKAKFTRSSSATA